MGLYKAQRTSSNIEKEKEFASFSQGAPPKDISNSATPIKTVVPDDTLAAMQLLSCIAPLNKLLQSNTRLLHEDQLPKLKCDDLTPKMIRNNFKKQPTFCDSGSNKTVVETKRYSSSFKNRY